MTKKPPRLYALIVGINQWVYPRMPPLEGCVNDALLMASVLKSRFEMDDEQLVVLTDQTATRAGITAAFRTHLIDRAKQWRAALSDESPPAFLFHFAGHGSRATDPTGTQADGLDETICPYDCRTPGVSDIRDWEIDGWLRELSAASSNVTIVLDCCHSGSATRDTEGTARKADPDLRPPTEVGPLVSRPEQVQWPTKPGTRSTAAQYVLLAACRNFEFAKEYEVEDDEGLRKHGAFTYFLAQELMQLPEDSELSYGELYERVRNQVHGCYRAQLPVCLGDRNRVLFGGARVVREPMISVTKVAGDWITVDAGLVHGLNDGAELDLYPPDTRTRAEAEPVGKLEVIKAFSVKSRCKLAGSDSARAPAVAPLFRATLRSVGAQADRESVRLELEDPARQSELSQLLNDPKRSMYVEVRPAAESFVVRQESRAGGVDCLTIRDRSGVLLLEPVGVDDLETTADNLAALARYQTILRRKNKSPKSRLKGTISVKLHLLDDSDDAILETEGQRSVYQRIDTPTTPEGIPILEVEKPFCIEIINASKQPVFCEAVIFGVDFSITPVSSIEDEDGDRIYEGQRKRVDPGDSQFYGLDATSDPLVYYLPDDEDAASQFVEVHEFVKVFATLDESDYESLSQGPLELPSDETKAELDAVFHEPKQQPGTRSVGAKRRKNRHDWTTAEIEYIAMRKPSQGTHTMVGGKSNRIPEFDVSVEPPHGLNCQVRVNSTNELASRATTEGSTYPMGMVFESGDLQPRSLSSRRATGAAGDTLELMIDPEASETVNRDRPLKIQLPRTTDDATTLAIAWDGEIAYPLGLCGPEGTIEIGWLPEGEAIAPPSTHASDPQAMPGEARGILRSVKVLFYKALKREPPELGLHGVSFTTDSADAGTKLRAGENVVRIEGGEIRYRPVEAQVAAKRFALLVHDVAGNSQTLVPQFARLCQGSGIEYDEWLAFDFESINTSVRDNAEKLATALKQAGFHAEDDRELTIVAHGVGGLVARGMIELFGGREFTDKCVMAGPPNQGTPIALSTRLLPWLTTLALSQFGLASLQRILSWIAEQGEVDMRGLNDLVPGSDFLKELDARGTRSTRYFVLAGMNVVAGDPNSTHRWANAWTKIRSLGDKTLDLILGGEHDLLVGVDSMTTLHSQADSRQDVECVTMSCHHFAYFDGPRFPDTLERWLKH